MERGQLLAQEVFQLLKLSPGVSWENVCEDYVLSSVRIQSFELDRVVNKHKNDGTK